MKMEEWKEYKLGDIYEVHNGLSKGGKFFGSGYPFLSFSTIFNNWFIPDELSNLVQSTEKEQESYSIKEGDVFITRTSETADELGMSCVALKDYPKATYNGFCKRMRQYNQNIEVLPKYIGYYLRNPNFRLYFQAFSGSMSTRASLTNEALLGLTVKLPPLPTQQKIAAILSSLDDKIELNNKINTNLEQQAGALFKNWFVDFEPFGGKMPEGWKVGKLSEILCLKKNPIQPGEDISLPYLPIDLIPIKSLGIREVRPNEEALSSLLRFDENDILIGAMRIYFHRVAIAPFDGITRTTCFVLEPFNPNYFAYAAITCNQDLAIDYAQKTSKGSTMPYAVWEGGLGDFEIPIPDEATVEKFNNIVKPLLEQIKKSYFENKTLQELRESLLPKLMNGEIEV